MDTFLYQRLLSRLAIMVTLAVITGIMASVLATGLFYSAYLLLVRHGLEMDAALVIVGIAVAAMVAICAALTVSAMRKLRRALQPLSPITSGIGDIASAFVGGLRKPTKQPKHD